MIARVAAVLSSSRDWKENVLQFAPDNSQQDNKTLQVTNTSRTKLGKTYHLNFARWRRGSCAGRIPSLLKPIFARIAARKGLGTVSRPGTIECAPCSIPCQYLGQATHKILKWVYRRKKETLQSESMTAIDTCMQDTYRKGCENESSAKVMLHVHTCAKWVICMMRDWLVKKRYSTRFFFIASSSSCVGGVPSSWFLATNLESSMAPATKCSVRASKSCHTVVAGRVTWIYLDPKENIGKHISVKGSISMYKYN